MAAKEFISSATDGTEIAWRRHGSGAAVVLVHGITESGESWAPIVDRLESRFDVVVIDLRGHGRSGRAGDYGLAAMVGDIATVIEEAEVSRPHLVGHSLGGAVVSIAGAMMSVSSVVNVDQSLELASFKDLLSAVEPMLRDPEAFPAVIEGLFDDLMGAALADSERERLSGLRSAEQSVVLGVWRELLESSTAEVSATVDEALSGYSAVPVPYLSLFGVDPGGDYVAWLQTRIPGVAADVWADHGHYPHLVDPDRFVTRLQKFWEENSSPPPVL